MMAGSIILQTGTRSMSQLGGLAGKMPYTAVLAMIGGLTIIGIPPTSGFMAEWITFNGALQSGIEHAETIRVVVFALGLVATLLTAGYILWMYKRVFFGKIPERLIHVKDSNRYITATMAFLAAMTLIVGVYPDVFLVPISGYISNMFSNTPEVLPLPNADGGTAVNGNGGGGDGVTNLTSTSLMQPSQILDANSAAAQLHNVLLNENPSLQGVYHHSLLYYYDPKITPNGGLGYLVGEEEGRIIEVMGGST
jgi:formate hydrogenlyase subunit 3/multisubunit Na+/H+ antiporter MnhD subunit